MTKPNEFDRASDGIATKAEREEQIKARPVPRAELHLTPPGWDTAHIQRHLFQEAQARIKHIDERLKLAREKLENNHGRALQRGRARQDFGRGQ